ncbi:MAG: hypothetical protein LBT27_03015 [Prevotellaceae bacterium]|jgi:hypothetical protein|nr:hypothetical protein [Prevotellaceae bacterium]
METWWLSMSGMQQVVWCIAIATSLIFIIQMIMTFIGMDSHADFSGDVADTSMSGDHDMPFQLFTFRNFINFFLGFSWSYILFSKSITSQVGLVVLSTIIGVFIVGGVMLIFYALSRMTQEGNIYAKQTIGLTATVYFPIPAHEEGMGKIQVSVQKSIREYDAVTKGDALKTGNIVKIIKVIDENIVLVEKI